jgi:hypothetical protein
MRQARLAKEYGIDGFAIYHYHFGPQSYAGLGSAGADMDETVLKLLDSADGEVCECCGPTRRRARPGL